VSDEAKRFSDIVNGLLTFSEPWEIKNSWMAIRLQDGGYDGTLYDTRTEAIRHQSDEKLCCYFPIGNFIHGLTPEDAQLILDVQRHAYDSGLRVTDEQVPDVITSIEQGDILRAFQRRRSGLVN
jgi:hypothetical protein